METLYEGPPLDLPKFIGKAYAFLFVCIMYAACLPILSIPQQHSLSLSDTAAAALC